MATFKRVWSEMQFSFIHQTNPSALNSSDFLQLQFSSAINRIDNESPFLNLDFLASMSNDARLDNGATPASASELQTRFDDRHSSGIRLLHSLCSSQREWKKQRDFFSPRSYQQVEEAAAPQQQQQQKQQPLEAQQQEAGPSVQQQTGKEMSNLPPLTVRIGAIFTLYCLWQTQLVNPKILIYLPTTILNLFIKIMPELSSNSQGGKEALACLNFLQKSDAFMIGALRRPPFHVHLKQRRSQMVRKYLNGMDALMESSTMREALFRVRSDLGSLVNLGDLSVACREYEQKRSQVFQSLTLPRQTAASSSQGAAMPHLFPPNYSSQLLDIVRNESAAINSDLLPSNRQPGSKSRSVIREEARHAAAERSAAAAALPLNSLLESIRASSSDQGDHNTAPSSRTKSGNLAARTTISSLLGPKMGSGLMGPQQLALIRDLARKKEAEEVQEAWINMHSQALLLNDEEMDKAMDEEFNKSDQEEQLVRETKPLLIWCNKKAGIMIMRGEGDIEIKCLCDTCAQSDEPSFGPKDFCLHAGLKDKGRWKEAIFVDQRQGASLDETEDVVVDRSEWASVLDSLSIPKQGELPKLGAWMMRRTSGVGSTRVAGAATTTRKPRLKKRSRSQFGAGEDSAVPSTDPSKDPQTLTVGFVDPEYQDLLLQIDATLSAANAAKLLNKPAAASTVQGSGNTSNS